MTFLDFFAISCWPTAAIGVALYGIISRSKREIPLAWQRRILVTAFLFFFIPVFGFFVLAAESIYMLVDQDLFFLVFGAWLCWWQFPQSRKDATAKRVAVSVLGVVGIAMGTWFLVGDYALPRKYAIGVAERVTRVPFNRFTFVLYINGHRYNITRNLLTFVAIGRRVRVEYGVGSTSIFHAETLPTRHG